MKRTLFTLLLAALLALTFSQAALAEHDGTQPEGLCPSGFSSEHAMDHDMHHPGHIHAGTDADQNGDGYICVNHLTTSIKSPIIHVHVDNSLPLP